MEIAERMSRENREQFLTLVRMHLSFQLDFNTDNNEVDTPNGSMLKKLINFNKKTKRFASIKPTNPINTSTNSTKCALDKIRLLTDFLMLEQNIIQIGIFRRSGSLARQNDLRAKINEAKSFNLATSMYTVHDCASVLKAILSDLPEPLLTDKLYPMHCQIAEYCTSTGSPQSRATKETRILHSIQLLILLLPEENYNLLKEVIEMLHHTTKFEKSNKMSADSLAKLFTPHLICPKKITPEILHTTTQNMYSLISFMINKGPLLFDVPPKLAMDIRAYFVEQRRKQIKSPKQILSDSVISDSTANTVYTFIDRQKTAEAHVSNPTDTALAQLYAHIQSLPESSKKRKLIKQFNKENGHGMPRQLEMLYRLNQQSTVKNKNIRTLGKSVKKHFFQKRLILRTPKKHHSLYNDRVTRQLHLKRKLLFQSPFSDTQNFELVSPLQLLSPITATDGITDCETPISSVSTPISHRNNSRNDENSIKENTEDLIMGIDNNLLESSKKFENLNDESFDFPSTFICNLKKKSKFRSEPNLSRQFTDIDMPIINSMITRLTKSYSLGNVIDGKFSKYSIENYISLITSSYVIDDLQLDDPDFETTSNSQDELRWYDDVSGGIQKSQEFIERNSMSPITKSTQRMSKAMQESIMTPRSRKPVILLGALRSDQQTLQRGFPRSQEENENIIDSNYKPLRSTSMATGMDSLSENDIDESLWFITNKNKLFDVSTPEKENNVFEYVQFNTQTSQETSE